MDKCLEKCESHLRIAKLIASLPLSLPLINFNPNGIGMRWLWKTLWITRTEAVA